MMEVIETEWIISNKEVDLLHIEEDKLDNLNLELLRLKDDGEPQLKEKDDTPTLQKSSRP